MQHVGQAAAAGTTWYEAQIDELFRRHRCEHIYLDCGTNIGVQIRKLFEPHKYDPRGDRYYYSRSATWWFERNFGKPPRSCRVCAIGFEPNPVHAMRLELLQRTYRAGGAGVLIFHAALAEDDEHNLTFNPGGKRYGATLIEGKVMDEHNSGAYHCQSCKLYQVPSIRLATVLRRVQWWLGANANTTRSRVLMKLDVEGKEFDIFPDVLRVPQHAVPTDGVANLARLPAGFRDALTGPLCIVNEIICEWHGRLLNASEFTRAENTSAWYRQVLDKDTMPHSCPTAILKSLDDEGYRNDGKPWPAANESLCVDDDVWDEASQTRKPASLAVLAAPPPPPHPRHPHHAQHHRGDLRIFEFGVEKFGVQLW